MRHLPKLSALFEAAGIACASPQLSVAQITALYAGLGLSYLGSEYCFKKAGLM